MLLVKRKTRTESDRTTHYDYSAILAGHEPGYPLCCLTGLGVTFTSFEGEAEQVTCHTCKRLVKFYREKAAPKQQNLF